MAGSAVGTNISDLYQQLELARKLKVTCVSDTDFYALRASIYRARQRYLEAFALIDDTADEDGFKLVVRWIKDDMMATLELVAKVPARQWIILP